VNSIQPQKLDGSRKISTNLFDKDPAGDSENIRRNYAHEKRGVHFYFRNMLLPIQERFAQLMDHRKIPRAFLHGNPHVDNYAKTPEGAAMVDFDRSRVGPYAWDLVRFMVSLSLRQKKEHGFLDHEAARALRKGYLHGFRHPDRPFSEMRKLKDMEPGPDETSTNAYLTADKKWAREMRDNPLPPDDPDIRTLLKGYVKYRKEPGLLRDYFVEEAGLGQGSMGFRRLFLVVLAPRDAKSGKDRIFLNIKEERSDPDTRWYKNPFHSDGERMRHAADLYAPGWELRPGLTELNGKQFYVMQMPPMKAKLKKMLKQSDLQDLAYAAGTQLGRGHRLGLSDGATAEKVETHVRKHYEDILKAGEILRGEIAAAHERYLKNMADRGLTPKNEPAADATRSTELLGAGPSGLVGNKGLSVSGARAAVELKRLSLEPARRFASSETARKILKVILALAFAAAVLANYYVFSRAVTDIFRTGEQQLQQQQNQPDLDQIP
jgi:hypothetical protein